MRVIASKKLTAVTSLLLFATVAWAETVFVKSVADSGPNTLRAALTFANAHPNSTIAFSIPRAALKDGVATIKPKTPLPPLRAKGTRLDGTTQARFIGDTNPKGPEIIIEGAQDATYLDPNFAALLILADHCTVSGLVINSFGKFATGITISGAQANNNRVTGCYFGTDATGTAVLGNSSGVRIAEGAHHNTIGGTSGGSGNLISGNFRGINIRDKGTDNNVVQGNYIGTDISGTIKLPNESNGIVISDGARQNLIGGTTIGARNVISSNGLTGILIAGFGTDQNKVQGNYIGTNANGSFALGNDNAGIYISDDAKENVIGGVEAGAGNLISGNMPMGVGLFSRAKNNKVQGNRIGTDAAGTAAVPNGDGVGLRESVMDNLVGGTAAGAGNLISGNENMGIAIVQTGTLNNRVEGNIIGLDVTAAKPLPNKSGIALFKGATSNHIGGSAAGAANIIAGNTEAGVILKDDLTRKNVVQGNLIGMDRTQTVRLLNGNQGVWLGEGARDNIIGGPQPGEANVIAAQKSGVVVDGDKTTGNLTSDNLVDSTIAGQWRSGQTKNEFTPMEWDVTPALKKVKILVQQPDAKAADYVFRFQYTGGAHRLDIEWAELLENGKVLSRDTHPGSTGNEAKGNEYRFSLPVIDPKATYTLRASILSGGDSNGEIQLSRQPPK